MEFTVYIPQEVALKNCSTEFGHVKISADRFERVLLLLEPEERELLRVNERGQVCIRTLNSKVCIECDSSEVEDIVKGIQACYKYHLVERMKVIQENQEKLDHIEANPEDYISKLKLKPKWEAHPDRLRQRCEAAHNDNLDHYLNLIEKTLETAQVNWWDLIKNEIVTQLTVQGHSYIEVEGERLNWQEIQTLSQKHNLAVEPIKEMNQVFKQAERDKEREAEKREERIKEGRKTWIDWCKEHGSEDLKWAIENDYPLGSQYQAEVINYLLPGETDEYQRYPYVNQDHGLRKVPNKQAREAHKALSACVETIPDIPPNTSVKVGKIHSVSIYVDCDCQGEDSCDKCDDDFEVRVKRTAIPVTVKALHVEHESWYVIEED